MRIFNRVLVILISLAVIVLAIAVMAAPYQVVDAMQGSLGQLRQNLTDATFWAITVLILVVLALLAVLVVALQFWPRPQKTVRIYAQGRGNARLRVESVAQTLEYRIDELPGVRRVEPHLFSRGKDLVVALDVDAASEASIPALSDQIIDRALRILEGELGLQVRGRIRLDISHEAYLPGAAPQERPAVAAAHPTAATAAVPSAAEPRHAQAAPLAQVPVSDVSPAAQPTAEEAQPVEVETPREEEGELAAEGGAAEEEPAPSAHTDADQIPTPRLPVVPELEEEQAGEETPAGEEEPEVEEEQDDGEEDRERGPYNW